MTLPRYFFFNPGPTSCRQRPQGQLFGSPRQESQISEQARARQTEKGLSIQINQTRMVQPEKRRKMVEEGKRGCREEVISWLFKHI